MILFPAVSVVISTYNRPKMLDRALASVHAQDFTDFEVWVVDDHSPCFEEMTEVLAKWHGRFEKRGIPFYAARLPYNSGYQCVPKNNGIVHSNGDFIAYLDDDNVWMPNHLSVLFEAILREDVDMVYGGRRYVNNTDRKDLLVGDVPADPWDPARLSHENYIDTSDMLHSKGILYMMANEDGYMWNENLMRFADWNLVHRMARHGFKAAPVDAILTEYHWHGENLQLTRPAISAPATVSLEEYEAAIRRKAGK